MRRASSILMRIGGILSIVFASLFLVSSFAFLIWALPAFHDAIVKAINEGAIHSSYQGSPDQVASLIQGLFVSIGISFIVMAAFNVANSVFALRGRKLPSRKISILNIVFGILSGVEVNAVGGIFGLIAEGIEERNDEIADIEK